MPRGMLCAVLCRTVVLPKCVAHSPSPPCMCALVLHLLLSILPSTELAAYTYGLPLSAGGSGGGCCGGGRRAGVPCGGEQSLLKFVKFVRMIGCCT